MSLDRRCGVLAAAGDPLNGTFQSAREGRDKDLLGIRGSFWTKASADILGADSNLPAFHLKHLRHPISHPMHPLRRGPHLPLIRALIPNRTARSRLEVAT